MPFKRTWVDGNGMLRGVVDQQVLVGDSCELVGEERREVLEVEGGLGGRVEGLREADVREVLGDL